MAALVTAPIGDLKRVNGVFFRGPTKVADANETDLSTPNTSIVLDMNGVRALAIYVKFANYTSVTVKLQESVDATNYVDIGSATTSTSNTFIKVTPATPWIRLSIAGTLSGGADTMEVWAWAEHYASH